MKRGTNRVDSFASSLFLTESILWTIELNVAYVKSIFTTIESRGFDQADFMDNRVDPGDAGNTFELP